MKSTATRWSSWQSTIRGLEAHGYGCEIIAEKVDFLSRPKTAEGEGPELVDNSDEVGF